MSQLEDMSREDFSWFKTTCECSVETLELQLDYNEEDAAPEIRIYGDFVECSYFYDSNWFQKILRRFRLVFDILIMGRRKTQFEFIFRNDEQIQEFAEKLSNWKKYVKLKEKFKDKDLEKVFGETIPDVLNDFSTKMSKAMNEND